MVSHMIKDSFLKLKMSLAMFTLLSLWFFPTFTWAEGVPTEKGALTPPPTEGTPSRYLNYGSSSTNSFLLQSYNLFDNVINHIWKNNDGTVIIDGLTTTKDIVSELSVTLFLEKWDGAKWITVTGEYLFKKTNDFKVSGSKTLVVTKGYYYRTKSAHTAKKGSTTESVTNYSDYILVSQ